MAADHARPDKKLLPRLHAVVSFLIVVLTLFLSIWRILLWQIINPLLAANFHRLMVLFGLPGVELRIDWTSIGKVMSLFVIVAVLVLLATRNPTVRHRKFLVMCLPLLGILIIIVLSQFWSVNVSSTIKRAWFFLAVALGGVYIGLEFRRARIILFFEILSIVFVLFSYVFVLAYPRVGIMTFDTPGAWRGLFDYKSFTGVLIGIASLLFLFRLLNFRNERWFVRLYAFLFLLISLYFLYRTRNATALGAFVLCVGVLLLGLLFIRFGQRLRPAHWWLIGASIVTLLLLAWGGRDELLGLLGRNVSLTGRIPMWQTLFPFIKQRLWFGYGFGETFWLSNYLAEFWKVAPWPARLAHSGYLEAMLDTGLVGLFFWVVFLVEELVLSLKLFFNERTLYALIFFTWSVFCLINNVTEDMLGTYELFVFLLLVVAFAFGLREHLSGRSSTAESPPGLSG
jgi:exopolysaccharide production protein ExoQ